MTSDLDDRLRRARRVRILAAAQMLLCEDPDTDLRLTSICARARVSRRTVYESFDDQATLVLALFDDLVGQICATLADARQRHASSWLDGVRAALGALLDLLDSSPGVARFLIVGSLAGDDALLERRARVLAIASSELDRGAPSSRAGSTPAPFGAEAVVGAIVSILHARLLEDPVPPLRPLLASLMSVIVLPYIGVEASRAEFERSAGVAPTAGDPARTFGRPAPEELSLSMRLTRRTLQVLTLVAEHPSISNSELAVLAGIRDAGQTSRLLSRLRRLGLLEHVAVEETHGVRNAWTVTSKGSRLLAEVGPRQPGPAA